MLFLPNLLKTNSASIDTKCWCIGKRSNGTRYNVARSLNPNRILITHLNIISLRNKFETLKQTIKNKVDILLISEKKSGSSFPLNQFFRSFYYSIYPWQKSNRWRHSVHWGITTPIKNTTPSFLPSPSLNLQTVQAPLFLAIRPYILFSLVYLPSKTWIFPWTPKILKFFILHHILSFKSN